MKEELCEKVVEARRMSDSDGSCTNLSKRRANVDSWAYSTKWMKF